MTNQNKLKKKWILCSLALIFIIALAVNSDAKIAFDNDCPVTSVSNVNFSNGTAVFLPFNYAETNTTNSNLTIFLGTNTTYFCSTINASLSNLSDSRKVIFTPEFLNALKKSSCNATFENFYMENFRKSGDIYNSSGTLFCGLKNLTLSNINLTGISFDYPFIGNLSVNSSQYNGSHLKKYALAYLINNPSVTLSGVISTFADTIGLNFTAACSSTGTVSTFFNAGKGNYSEVFSPKILGINLTAGEQLKPSDGTPGGIFGWLMNFALGNQTMPIITAMNLSSNKVYTCGLITITDEYSNSNVTITTNSTTVNASSVNTTLEILTNGSVTNSTIEVISYPQNPKTAGAVGVIALNKYLGIRIDSNLTNVLSSVIIKVYYTDAEVSAAGLNESTLRLYYYNETSGNWSMYDSPNGGVNTTENYVWANTTHFSDWGIFGTAPATTSTGSRSGLTGGSSFVNASKETCSDELSCNAWEPCTNGKQTRTCTKCNEIINQIRSCVTLPLLPSIPTEKPREAQGITGEVTAPAVPLETLWLSLIALAIVIGIISWEIINRKNLRKRRSKKRRGK